MRVGDLDRNDVPGALAYAREVRATGRPLRPDEVHVLLMLQDDPAELQRSLDAGQDDQS